MEFNDIIGQDFLKAYFQKIIAKQRVPHTQMFVGDEGSGTLPMALAFARELLCGDNENCRHKVEKLIHPDLYFIFPSVTRDNLRKPQSDDFIDEWREFLSENPYGSLFDWHTHLNVANKQGEIRVTDAETLSKKVSVKPYEADYKVFIIWMAEKMNPKTANKLLKILEEPPEDTKFILIARKTDDILDTILSRCQIHHFNPVPVQRIQEKLQEKFQLDPNTALKIAHQANGSWNTALKLARNNNSDDEFQKLFIDWVRIAFSAKKNRQAIRKLIEWSENIATMGRENQKYFLDFALQTFRQAMAINYQNPQLAYFDFSANGFDLHKLAPFIHGNNITEIYQAVTDAMYHIERNANPKIIFLDLSIMLTKLIHKKENIQSS